MSVIQEIEKTMKKHHVVDVRSGDTVRVHQKIREGNKERVQVFEGLVIRTDRPKSLSASITVRRIASGIGVEKTYLVHSPLVTKIEVTKRSKVRRNYLSYMRERTGKSARLSSVDFDREAVNKVPDVEEKPAKPEPAAEDVQASEDDKLAKAETDQQKPDKPAENKTVEKETGSEKSDKSDADSPDSKKSTEEKS